MDSKIIFNGVGRVSPSSLSAEALAKAEAAGKGRVFPQITQMTADGMGWL